MNKKDYVYIQNWVRRLMKEREECQDLNEMTFKAGEICALEILLDNYDYKTGNCAHS